MVWKYFIVGIILAMGLVFVYMMDITQKSVMEMRYEISEISHCSRKYFSTKESEEMGRIRAILTIAGLIMAGAIAGFFRFSYTMKDNQNTKDKCGKKLNSRERMILGHVITGAQIIVIGMLLLLSLKCLSELRVSFELWIYFSCIGIVLLVSLICYDIFDYRRSTKESEDLREEIK